MHNPATLTGILIYLGVGLLWCAVAVPLVQGRVPRNPWYGFRVPKTLASDRVWYLANRYFGRQMLRAGRVVVVGSLVLLSLWLVVEVPTQFVALAGLALMGSIIPGVFRTFRYLRTL